MGVVVVNITEDSCQFLCGMMLFTTLMRAITCKISSFQKFSSSKLILDVGCRPLRSNSNNMRKLLVPRTHNRLGDRSFSAAGPRLWNDLLPGLRRPGLTFDSFRQSLKTHSFGDRSAFSDSFEFIGTIEISLSIYRLNVWRTYYYYYYHSFNGLWRPEACCRPWTW